MLLNLNTFSGVMPRINEQQLPAGAAVEASGFRTDSACIEPYKALGLPVPIMTGCRTMIVWPTNEDRVWPPGNDDAYIFFDKDIDYCYGAALGYDLLLFTGDEYPKYMNPKTGTKVRLGVSPPNSELYAADGVAKWIQVNPLKICVPVKHMFETGLDPDEIEGKGNGLTTISYCYTYIDNEGQESAPSQSSAFYEVDGFVSGQGLRLAGFTQSDAENNPISKYRIYRCQGGTGDDAEFLFIGEIPASQAYFDDYDTENHTFKTAEEAIKTEKWLPPPKNLKGIVNLTGGVVAAYIEDSNTLCFSEPLIQYSWPEKYQIKTPQPILHIISLGDELVVFMASLVMSVRGEPGAFSLSSIYGGKGTPCITGRGFVNTDAGLLFPGHDGLYLYNGATCTNITEQAMTTLQWRSLLPDKFRAVCYDGRYWAFREESDKAITIDIKNGSVITIDISSIYPISGLHIDYHGRFFILSGANAYLWAEGDTFNEAVWMSGLLTFSSPVNLAAAIITTDSPTGLFLVSLEIWSHYRGVKTLVFDSVTAGITVPLNRPFRLPGGFLSASVQVRIKTSVTVRDIRFATSMSELGG